MDQTEASSVMTINGVQLCYKIRGNGPHALVCIPAALGTVETHFGPQMDYFGRKGSGYTIVSFDPRGYGRSRPADRWNNDFFITDAKDAHALMQALSFSNYSVLGWCSGGTAALILASLFPESVRKLVIWNSISYITDEFMQFMEELRDVSEWRLVQLKESMQSIYGASFQSIWSEWLDAIISYQAKNKGDICTNELSKIICSTLIINGAKDPLVPCYHAEYIRDHVKGSRLEVMKEASHEPHMRSHQKFNKIVEAFLEE